MLIVLERNYLSAKMRSELKHVFWVLKRTVSLRRFFCVPTTYDFVEKNIFICFVCLMLYIPVNNLSVMSGLLGSTKQQVKCLAGRRSDSVVECLTGDCGAAGASLTGVTAMWSLSKTHLSSLVLVQPR